MRYIGDVHAKFDQYKAIATEVSESIQVGDFGAGFRPLPEMNSSHRFIRGNHDNPSVCQNSPNWIIDGSLIDSTFFLGGGISIDRFLRTEGIDWWADEEVSTEKLYQAYDAYVLAKPMIVVTHECPYSVAHELFIRPGVKFLQPSRTAQCLESMFDAHKPDLWIFGHWHQSRDQIIGGTRFICLNELEYIDI